MNNNSNNNIIIIINKDDYIKKSIKYNKRGNIKKYKKRFPYDIENDFLIINEKYFIN